MRSVCTENVCMSPRRLDLRPGVTEPVVLLISRREIESGDVRSVIDRLLTLFRDPQSIWRYRGQLTLVIDGYNHDPRELVDIREVRSFLQGFDRHWPYWAFFFNQVDDSIKLYLSCPCGSAYLGGGAVEIDGKKLGDALMRGFAAMNSIFDDHRFPEDELETMSRGVIEVVEQAGLA